MLKYTAEKNRSNVKFAQPPLPIDLHWNAIEESTKNTVCMNKHNIIEKSIWHWLSDHFNFAGQTAPRQPAVNPDEQMIVHKEEILDPDDNDENQQVVLAGI